MIGRAPVTRSCADGIGSRIGNSIISRNGHNRYQKIGHGLIFCEQGMKKG